MIVQMVTTEMLKGTYLVAGLTDEQIAQVASLSEHRVLTSGQAIAKIGEAASNLFVVLEGNLIVTTADGDRLGEISEGSIIGEIALVDARPRTANVVSIGAVSVASIPITDLRKLMNDNRDWGFTILANVARVLAMRLRHADATIDELADKVQDVWTNAL